MEREKRVATRGRSMTRFSRRFSFNGPSWENEGFEGSGSIPAVPLLPSSHTQGSLPPPQSRTGARRWDGNGRITTDWDGLRRVSTHSSIQGQVGDEHADTYCRIRSFGSETETSSSIYTVLVALAEDPLSAYRWLISKPGVVQRCWNVNQLHCLPNRVIHIPRAIPPSVTFRVSSSVKGCNTSIYLHPVICPKTKLSNLTSRLEISSPGCSDFPWLAAI